jgi:hypothetical protein
MTESAAIPVARAIERVDQGGVDSSVAITTFSTAHR